MLWSVLVCYGVLWFGMVFYGLLRPPAQIVLAALLPQVCHQLRDNTQPPVNPVPLLQAVNACLPPANRFNPGQSECSVELLFNLLEQLPLLPGHITTYMERGTCPLCRQVVEQVRLTFALMLPLLFLLQDSDPVHGNMWGMQPSLGRALVPRGQREQPASLSAILDNHLADPTNSQVLCGTQGCQGYGQVSKY